MSSTSPRTSTSVDPLSPRQEDPPFLPPPDDLSRSSSHNLPPLQPPHLPFDRNSASFPPSPTGLGIDDETATFNGQGYGGQRRQGSVDSRHQLRQGSVDDGLSRDESRGKEGRSDSPRKRKELPEDLKQRGGLIYEDDECWVFKEVEKGRKLASTGHLTLIFPLPPSTPASIYSLNPSSVPLLCRLQALAQDLLDEHFPTDRDASVKIGFVSAFKDPLNPSPPASTPYLTLHAFLGPTDLATIWTRTVLLGPLGFYELDDLIAEIRESTSNNRIKTGAAYSNPRLPSSISYSSSSQPQVQSQSQAQPSHRSSSSQSSNNPNTSSSASPLTSLGPSGSSVRRPSRPLSTIRGAGAREGLPNGTEIDSDGTHHHHHAQPNALAPPPALPHASSYAASSQYASAQASPSTSVPTSPRLHVSNPSIPSFAAPESGGGGGGGGVEGRGEGTLSPPGLVTNLGGRRGSSSGGGGGGGGSVKGKEREVVLPVTTEVVDLSDRTGEEGLV